MSEPAFQSDHHDAPPEAERDAYAPRDPPDSVLVRAVRKHLPRFLEAVAADGGWPLPAFVREALRGLALCGDFTNGFTHFCCDRCQVPRIVPFSCKSRLCASCGGRRMSEFAAYAVDRVLPRCDYRQWVVSFPWELRRTLAFDAAVARAVFRIAGDVIMGWISGAAAEEGVFGLPAGILHIQRFGDGLTTNPDAHFVFSDAVFCPVESAGPSAEPAPGQATPVLSFRTRAPTPADVQLVADRVEHRVARFLARRSATASHDAEEGDNTCLARLAEAKPVASRSTKRSPSRPGPRSS